jgi:hypothetical protein
MHHLTRLHRILPSAALVLLAACQSAPEEPQTELGSAAPAEASAPFAPRLPGDVQLLADRIQVEGPPSLLDHLAVLQAEDCIESRTEGRPDGLFSEHRVLSPGLDAVQAQLDAWSLSAFSSLEVLMAELGRPLRVVATGGVRLVASGGEDLYAERLEFELDNGGRLWRSVDGAPRALAPLQPEPADATQEAALQR